nr:MAG TPA: hypothetical protein [Caudoviricetes sp.]
MKYDQTYSKMSQSYLKSIISFLKMNKKCYFYLKRSLHAKMTMI